VLLKLKTGISNTEVEEMKSECVALVGKIPGEQILKAPCLDLARGKET
jgi:hypothetical protein